MLTNPLFIKISQRGLLNRYQAVDTRFIKHFILIFVHFSHFLITLVVWIVSCTTTYFFFIFQWISIFLSITPFWKWIFI